MENLEVLNHRLARKYGVNLYGEPNWRLVWGPSQTEKRKGKFRVETESGIFLREEEGVREVKKYHYLPDCYVLENIQDCGDNPELNATSQRSYEPVWPFHDRMHLPLDPEWWAVEMVIENFYNNKTRKSNQAEVDAREEKASAKRIEETVLKLKDEARPFDGRLRDGEAIVVPNKRFTGDN